MFGFWKRKPQHSPRPKSRGQHSTAKFGGMQERVLQARLELLVDAVLTRHRSVIEPARALTEFSLVEQKRFLTSVDQISLIDQEFAFRFCHLAIPALAELEDTNWDSWISNLLSTFKNKGLDASTASIKSFRVYLEQQKPDSSSVAFAEIHNVLNIFIRALNGRTLKLAPAVESFTDTETLYLPEHINYYPTREENILLYKALLVHLWAQTWFGTWRIDLAEILQGFPDTNHALHLFHWLETQRLDACIERELPGLAREIAKLRPTVKELHPQLSEAQKELQKPAADVQTSLDYLSKISALEQDPEAAIYQGQLHPDLTAKAISERGEREYSAIQNELASLLNKMPELTAENKGKRNEYQPGFNTRKPPEDDSAEETQIQLEYDGTAVEITPKLQDLLNSVAQDYGGIPEHYMSPPEIDDITDAVKPDETVGADVSKNKYNYCYDEWDHARQRYRKDWCLLHEQSVKPVSGTFVAETLDKYRFLLKQLRRSFEELRQENRQSKREPFGDDFDIDSVVEAWTDTRNGLEASERLFIQNRRDERHVAVMFMIDMSASTTGWVNQVERESLILLCEALEQLGDLYAIYGFSGRGNRHCQSYHIKNFDESYTDEVRNRIEGIQAMENTRLGVAIRHLGAKLNQVDARTRLLITLTDGRPDDIDGYSGQYAIEDTRKALIEVRHMGIHPYCITIDTDARDYLPHMYGETNYIIIKQVDNLPEKIADFYRKLTQ